MMINGSLVGTKLGNYIIEEKIGHGQSSIVYRASYNGKTYAVKAIFKPTRFIENEKRAVTELDHPNILKCACCVEERGYIFFVMPWCPKTLSALLDERDTPFSEDEAKVIMKQLIRGLQYAHDCHFVHRDLKPENILVNNGKYIIADWGLCSTFTDTSYLAENVGSFLFSSPEVVNGRPYRGPEIDVWSLGCILYELVTQATPFYFEGDTKPKVRRSISASRYANDSYLTLSDDLRDLLKMMLDINPVKRISLDLIFTHPWFISPLLNWKKYSKTI